jgi:hypothetical protein
MFSRIAPFLLPVLLALPACATSEAVGTSGDGGPAAPTEAVDESSQDLKAGLDEAAFPMSAADFKQRLEARRTKWEAFAKDHHGKRGPRGDGASENPEWKARMEARKAEMQAKIDEACADGTVTLEEAKALRGGMFGGPKHGGHGFGGPPGAGGPFANETFPIAADAFKTKVATKRAEMKARFDEHTKDMPAEKLTEIQARITETNAKVDNKLAEITADGSVTKEEAESLMHIAFEGMRRGGPGSFSQAPGMGGHRRWGGEMEGVTFPVAADVFRQKIEARRAKMKEGFEKHTADIPAEKLTEMRAHMAEMTAKFDQKLNEITADGTVTEEEARSLHQGMGRGPKASDVAR